MRAMCRGERSPAVADLQVRLVRLGFDVARGEAGGYYGTSTEEAVRALQQQRGLVVDGVVGEATWRELVESSWSLGDRPLRLRHPPMRGDDVRELQTELNALGFGAGKHDGIFGARTAGALREFQSNLGIPEDGICGRETVRALGSLQMVIRRGLGPRTRERQQRESAPPGLAYKRIALDPGSGGGDAEAAGGPEGAEGELCFRLAAETARMLSALGAESILTRGPNDAPGDSERARRANRFGADLFVGIRLNAYESGVAEGAASYYFEHGGIASEPGQHLAGLLQSELSAAGRPDCRSHGKSFPVLRETRMPAVVVEPCFITNPAEVELLSGPLGRTQIASAMVRAISRYFS